MMRRLLAGVLLALTLLPAQAWAIASQDTPGYLDANGQFHQYGASIPVTGGVYIFSPLGCQQLTSLSSATGFSSVPTGATLATFSVESQSVRYRDDGASPTASAGILLPVAGPWPYQGNLSAIKFIQTTASATIDVCFYQ